MSFDFWCSIDYPVGEWEKVCNGAEAKALDLINPSDKGKKVTYTYSVDWKESPTTWANRWRTLPMSSHCEIC